MLVCVVPISVPRAARDQAGLRCMSVQGIIASSMRTSGADALITEAPICNKQMLQGLAGLL